MQLDLYTKFILTVIAICLVWLAFKPSGDLNLFPEAQAQMVVAQSSGVTDVNIVSISGKRISSSQVSNVSPALPVQAQGK